MDYKNIRRITNITDIESEYRKFDELLRQEWQKCSGEELQQDVQQIVKEAEQQLVKEVKQLRLVQQARQRIRFLLQIQQDNQPEPIYQKIVTRLPEDYRSDLFQLRERWQKKGLSPKEIKYLTYKHLIHIIFGLIQVKIQNFLLFRYSSNKDN